MKLAKGTLKIIVGDLDAAIENQTRARNNGRIFKPVYTVYEWDEDMEVLEVRPAHSFAAPNLQPRTTIASSFPYAWAPSALKRTVMWLETTGELTLLNQEDAYSGK